MPALVLAEIERRSGRAVSELFQIITGSSTGSVLALGLATPDGGGRPRYTALQLAQLLEDDGARIFHAPILRRIRTASGLIGPRYAIRHLRAAMQAHFGGVCLADVLSDVLVPSYDLTCRQPLLLTNRTPQFQRLPLWEVALAASAAPSYFAPVPVTIDGERHVLVDGGIFMANTAMFAYTQARALGVVEADMLLVSLGTGKPLQPMPYTAARGWGMLNWAFPLLEVVPDSYSETVDLQVRQLFGEPGNGRYYRLQAPLGDAHFAFDNASPENIRAIKKMTVEFIDTHAATLDALCARLLADAPERRQAA